MSGRKRKNSSCPFASSKKRKYGIHEFSVEKAFFGFERPWIGRGRSSNPIQSLIMFSGLFSSSVIDAFTFIISKNMLKKKSVSHESEFLRSLEKTFVSFLMVVE